MDATAPTASTAETTEVVAAEETLAPTTLPVTPTETATLMPVTQQSSSESSAGLIIFSMADGEFKHLFAYHPSYLPITRITDGTWDDDYPAVDPKGTKILYTSNRLGTWDIYILDLVNKTTTQITNNSDFESSPSWSPDGQWITYDTYNGSNFNIMIQSISDVSMKPIQLTDQTGNNFDPSFSPDGTKIIFVSDRSGKNEIWLADLNSSDNRFAKVMGDSEGVYSDPVWSPDGQFLAWTRFSEKYEIQVFDFNNPVTAPITIGSGEKPIWMPDGHGLLVTIETPNQNSFVAYSTLDQHLMLPPITISGTVTGYDWKAESLSANIHSFVSVIAIKQPEPLWTEVRSISPDETGRYGLVPLVNVEAPEPYLSDTADESYSQMRLLVEKKLGWDLLSTLENASLSITTESIPGITKNWLYTGRAISLNMVPYEAGWMVVSREEFNGEIYWRVWLRCQNQDGSCGVPLRSQTWDFSSRYSGDSGAYESGGRETSMPPGYWIDFTELANRFGWERLPSESNWRSYFPGILFNQFVFKQGRTWDQALRELYPTEVVDLILKNIQ